MSTHAPVHEVPEVGGEGLRHPRRRLVDHCTRMIIVGIYGYWAIQPCDHAESCTTDILSCPPDHEKSCMYNHNLKKTHRPRRSGPRRPGGGQRAARPPRWTTGSARSSRCPLSCSTAGVGWWWCCSCWPPWWQRRRGRLIRE